MVNETKLRNHLLKCELQYRADHADGAETLDWLAPHCGTVESAARFLRDLGFRIVRTVDEADAAGERMAWVETTSGVVVYAGTQGLFAKGAKKP